MDLKTFENGEIHKKEEGEDNFHNVKTLGTGREVILYGNTDSIISVYGI